jgi:hypothetical protein
MCPTGQGDQMADDDLAARRRAAAEHLKRQAPWCLGLGSPLYATLLERSAADCETGGVVWSILEGQEHESIAAAVALRFMGAVHRLVLAGEVPELARHYPSAGGRVGDLDDAWTCFRRVLVERRDRLRELARLPVQTNEVGRSAVLLGGFLAVARRTCLPLRLLEIGSSAGLNLRWDRYRYEMSDAAWGDPASPVKFSSIFTGARPAFDVPLEVAERSGCDVAPIDPCSPEGRATLRAYLWPDQTERLQRLDGALQVAESLPLAVERIGAQDFLTRELSRRTAGTTTVVFHSIMIQYLPRAGRERVFAIIREAGQRADPRAPVAWLRFEPAKDRAGNWMHRVDLTLWPDGEETMLGYSSPHGPPVTWIADQ